MKSSPIGAKSRKFDDLHPNLLARIFLSVLWPPYSFTAHAEESAVSKDLGITPDDDIVATL